MTEKDKTIRQEISEITNELFSFGDMLEPVIASTRAVKLSALHSRVVRELVEREIKYKRKLEEIHLANSDKSVAYARLRAEATSEFADWKEAEGNLRACLEMIRSLKRFETAVRNDIFASRNL